MFRNDLGWFHKLCADYHMPGIQFDRNHIHVMRDAQSHTTASTTAEPVRVNTDWPCRQHR